MLLLSLSIDITISTINDIDLDRNEREMEACHQDTIIITVIYCRHFSSVSARLIVKWAREHHNKERMFFDRMFFISPTDGSLAI